MQSGQKRHHTVAQRGSGQRIRHVQLDPLPTPRTPVPVSSDARRLPAAHPGCPSVSGYVHAHNAEAVRRNADNTRPDATCDGRSAPKADDNGRHAPASAQQASFAPWPVVSGRAASCPTVCRVSGAAGRPIGHAVPPVACPTATRQRPRPLARRHRWFVPAPGRASRPQGLHPMVAEELSMVAEELSWLSGPQHTTSPPNPPIATSNGFTYFGTVVGIILA